MSIHFQEFQFIFNNFNLFQKNSAVSIFSENCLRLGRITKDHQRSLKITQDHPRSRKTTKDHQSSPKITDDLISRNFNLFPVISFCFKNSPIGETPYISTNSDSRTNIFFHENISGKFHVKFFIKRLQVMDLFRVLLFRVLSFVSLIRTLKSTFTSRDCRLWTSSEICSSESWTLSHWSGLWRCSSHNLESLDEKSWNEKGTYMDIATTRPNQPIGTIWWKFSSFNIFGKLPEGTNDHQRLPKTTKNDQRSPKITQDHPRSPNIIQDHPRTMKINQDHPR